MSKTILVACEFSGAISVPLSRLPGVTVHTCDYEEHDVNNARHYRGDVRDLLYEGWDGIIAMPPCTYLARSGLHHNKNNPARQHLTQRALDLVQQIMDAPSPCIVVENPYGKIGSAIRKADQVVQPFWFGDPISKSTCLWLKGLPLLVPTNVLPLPDCGHWDNNLPSGQYSDGTAKGRAKRRSVTPPGLGAAMADQWGCVICNR